MDLSHLRRDFPILFVKRPNGKPLIYFDNAATTLKPQQVMNAVMEYYEKYPFNVHRGVYKPSQELTDLYEKSREKIAKFIGCGPEELVFVKNTTEGINLVAYGIEWKTGDEVVTSPVEHHSNMIPWQIMKKRFGITLKYVDITKDGQVDLESLSQLVSKNTRIVSVCHVSNVLGSINDIKEIAKIAHENEALLLVDAAQSVPHMPINVKDLECDLLVFSGHKMLGPTGIGCLYMREGVEEEIVPPFGGGEMISSVELNDFRLNDMPWRFEPGTPNIAGALGLAAAVDYLCSVGMGAVREHEKELTAYALKLLGEDGEIEIYGPKDAEKRSGLIAFNIRNVSGHLVAMLLDELENIAVRSGFHCAEPLHRRLGIRKSVRASFYIYNTKEELEIFGRALSRVKSEFLKNDKRDSN